MSFWFGKALGTTLGLFTGGPFGALVGLMTGSLLDQAFSKKVQGDLGTIQNQAQQLYYRATFRALGRLAKADGRVSEQEIKAASVVMDFLGLKGKQRQFAIEQFNEGKAAECNIDADLRQLRSQLQGNSSLLTMFFDFQLRVAYADGDLTPEGRRTLVWMCQHLGVNPEQFEWFYAHSTHGRAGSQRQQSGWQARGQVTAHDLTQAYQVLGVSASCTDAELKKAYRKLMSLNHPDKLVAQNVTDTVMRRAKEKTQQIQTAYDKVTTARK